jgi:hypothetical protein
VYGKARTRIASPPADETRAAVVEDSMSIRVRIVLAAALGALLLVAALAIEPAVVGERPYPYGPVSLAGGAFTARPGHAVDFELAAESARRALPDHVVVVTDWSEEPMLVVGRAEGATSPEDLRRWRDESGLPLAGPEQIGFGCSPPDWFSRERRTHDAGFAIGAAAVAAALVVLPKRRLRPAGAAAV